MHSSFDLWIWCWKQALVSKLGKFCMNFKNKWKGEQKRTSTGLDDNFRAWEAGKERESQAFSMAYPNYFVWQPLEYPQFCLLGVSSLFWYLQINSRRWKVPWSHITLHLFIVFIYLFNKHFYAFIHTRCYRCGLGQMKKSLFFNEFSL